MFYDKNWTNFMHCFFKSTKSFSIYIKELIMSLHIQSKMHTYVGTLDYSQKKGCLPVATWVDGQHGGFDLFFRHIFSDQRKHIGTSGWTFYPHDNEFTPGLYQISKAEAKFLREFYQFQIKTILKTSFDSTCSVCLEQMNQNQNIFIFQCKHTVHVQCCRKTQKQLHYYTCPNCRVGLDRIDTITLEKEEPICLKLVEFLKGLAQPIKRNTHPRYLQFSFKIGEGKRKIQVEKKVAKDNALVKTELINQRAKVKYIKRVVQPQKKPQLNPEEKSQARAQKKSQQKSQVKPSVNPEPKLEPKPKSEVKPQIKPEVDSEEVEDGWTIVRSKKRQQKCRYGSRCWYGDDCRHSF